MAGKAAASYAHSVDQPVAVDAAISPTTTASRCPIDHSAAAAPSSDSCPVRPAGSLPMGKADLAARRMLRIPERPAGTSAQAFTAFRRSMFISATRCLLTYVVFPFVLPAVGFATGVGPIVGLVIGTLAIVCDVFAIRRFHAVGHKWRWHFTAIAVGIICLLLVLLVQDIVHLLT